VSDAQLAAINISRHAFHGDWNYTILPNQPVRGRRKAELTYLFKDKTLAICPAPDCHPGIRQGARITKRTHYSRRPLC
jgi:hypothetical protein